MLFTSESFGWDDAGCAKKDRGCDEPLGGRDEHEDAGDKAQGVEKVARDAGNDGESRIVAFDPSGDEHEDDVGEDAPVPHVEGPASSEDPAIVAEELDQHNGEERSEKAGDGDERVADEAVGEFEVVEHTGQEHDPAGDDEESPPPEERSTPVRVLSCH